MKRKPPTEGRPLTPAEERLAQAAICRRALARITEVPNVSEIAGLIEELDDRLAQYLAVHVPRHNADCPVCGNGDDTADPESFISIITTLRGMLFGVGRAFITKADALVEQVDREIAAQRGRKAK